MRSRQPCFSFLRPVRRVRLAVLAMAGSLLSSAPFPLQAALSLYWTATDNQGALVVRAGADGSNPTPIVSGPENILGPNGLETDGQRLYWPDQQLGTVQQSQADGSGVRTLATTTNPYDVFPDATGIHWTSRTANFIDRQLADGSGYRRLLEGTDAGEPFAVQLTATHLYWSRVSSGSSGSLMRADPEGANAVTLIPNVVVYDFQVTADFIYFADIRYPGGALKRANLDGTGVTNLVTAPFGGVDLINGIFVTSDALYWSEYNVLSGGGIRRTDLNGRGRVDLYNAPPGTGIRGVVLLDPSSATVDTPAPRFGIPRVTPTGLILTLSPVKAGSTYRIETSSTLGPWTEWTHFVAGGEASVTLTNPMASDISRVFFRARTP